MTTERCKKALKLTNELHKKAAEAAAWWEHAIVLAKERHTIDGAERWYLAWVCTPSNQVQILAAKHGARR